jgi:hypothetical protein
MAGMRRGRMISAPAVILDELIDETRLVDGGGRQRRRVPGVLAALDVKSVIMTARISKVEDECVW